MEREDLAVAFYGDGPLPLPWASDCPVRFDAWLALAQSSPELLEHRVDLILEVNEEHGVRPLLEQFHKIGATNAQPLAAASFVVARLTLAELVRAVLPMTNLHSVLRSAKRLGPGLRAAIEAPATPALLQGGEDEREQERRDQLAWFLNLLRAVAGAATSQPARRSGRRTAPAKTAPAQSPTAAVAMMLEAVELAPEQTPLPGAARSGIADRRRRYPVVSVTRNRTASAAVTRSRATVKADAAEQLFAIDCSTIGWAVVDSGIDAEHPAFGTWDEGLPPGFPGPSRVSRAFDFVGARETLSADAAINGLINWDAALPYVELPVPSLPPPPGPPLRAYVAPVNPHGTHVAGIIGGDWPERGFRGLCPTIRLYDLRVLGHDGKGDEFAIVTALQAIRYLNEQAGRLAIAGVNLSLSVPHDVAAHACGWTPVCIECDRLVRSGVVVVTASGNAGYAGGTLTTGIDYRAVSISDPGNTEAVITVGSTHRSDPHRHGVSYFSGRGPTADGRPKPDLLAPGEDIDGPIPGSGIAAMHGTSQAAAHVSGAAAMLLARHRELLGRPERVKSVLMNTASDLGRERAFQGTGLIDVLRALQSM